jgi:hypothetical protein
MLLAQPLAPAHHRRPIEGQLVAEYLLAAEVLAIRVLHPARAENLVRERMHVLLYSANRGQALSGHLAL